MIELKKDADVNMTKFYDAIETAALKAQAADSSEDAVRWAEAAQRMGDAYCRIMETHIHLEFHLAVTPGEEDSFPLPGESPLPQ